MEFPHHTPERFEPGNPGLRAYLDEHGFVAIRCVTICVSRICDDRGRTRQRMHRQAVDVCCRCRSASAFLLGHAARVFSNPPLARPCLPAAAAAPAAPPH